MRKPLPEAIANAPELYTGLEMYYVAFFDLTSTRAIGSGEGPISWLTMQQYCQFKQLSEEQQDDLIFHVSKMDAAYLEHRTAKLKTSTGPKPKGKPVKKR